MRVLKLQRCKRVVSLSWHPGAREIAAVTSAAEDHVGSIIWLQVATGEAGRTIPLDVERCALRADHTAVAIGHSAYTRPGGASSIQWAEVPKEGTDLKWINLQEVPHPHIFGLTFTPQRTALVAGCIGQLRSSRGWVHAVHIAPLAGGEPITFALDTVPGAIALSADEKWMALSGGPGAEPEVRCYLFPSPESSATYWPKATRTQRLLFHPTRPVLVALAGKQVHLLTAGETRPMAVLDGHAGRVNDAAFSPDGERLFTVGQDSTVRVWDARTGAAIRGFDWAIGKLTAVAVSPDGCTAAAAGDKGQVVIWDLDE